MALAQPAADLAVAQPPGDPAERLQVHGLGARGHQEHEDEIDRLVVDRLEGDGVVQTPEEGVQVLDPLEAGVGQRDAFTDAGRAQLLALLQGGEDLARRDVGGGAGGGGDLAQQLPLAGDPHIHADVLGR